MTDHAAAADAISISWHVDDVLSVRPDLTREQARTVLAHALFHYDAEIGINWNVLSTIADALFP
ncbi:MAG: hypothetical protein ACOY45_04490 [Pseudomonadota bacterium]